MTADAVGGVWQYSLDLALGLAGSGIAVSLAVLGPAPGLDQHAEAMMVPGLDLVETGLPLDWTADEPAAVMAAGSAIAHLAETVGADLVHLNSTALAGGARYSAPVVAVCHSCVATWWMAVRTGPLPEEFVWRTRLVAKGLAAASALIAPSAAFSDATARAYGLLQPPAIVHNGRRALGASASPTYDVVAFTAGRLWDEGKNLATLDRAAALTEVPIRAAGPLHGPNGATIALPNLHVSGRIPETALARELAARPIFVSAARYEPFGLAVLEAAQAGCPLVLSEIPTFRELWDGAALFVEADDATGFAAALDRLAADAPRRAELGAAAQARAARYTLEAMVAGTLGVYRAVLGAGTKTLDGVAA